MTLQELDKMRRMRVSPAYPIVLTADSGVHAACVDYGLPVMWTPGFADDEDLRALHGLPLWLVTTTVELSAKLREIQPGPMWIVGRHGFADRINKLVGRRALEWN